MEYLSLERMRSSDGDREGTADRRGLRLFFRFGKRDRRDQELAGKKIAIQTVACHLFNVRNRLWAEASLDHVEITLVGVIRHKSLVAEPDDVACGDGIGG